MAKRTIIQALTTIIYNANLPGFWQGKIWQGSSKQLCVPGLNCYSCPGALGACPIGSLQSSMGGVFLRVPFFVLGMLLLFGLLLGRLICGWGCPFGFVQELLHKIPSPKLSKNSVTRKLTLLKYAVALLFVVLLPLFFFYNYGVGIPAFCKYICPAGTLEAALPLLLTNENLRNSVGWLFSWKLFVLLIIVLSSVFVYRPFCRFLCPLGAWYSLYNRLALFGLKVDDAKCIDCNACIKVCKMDCLKAGDRECINCGECLKVCPTQAIYFKKL